MRLFRNKKIIFYVSLFFIIGTFNNKNLNNFEISKINQIEISGLSKEKNFEISQSLESYKIDNLFFLSKFHITDLLYSYNYIEDFFVFKNYPSTLNIKLKETKYLALVKKGNEKFYFGSNGKLIKAFPIKKDLPYVFGSFKKMELLKLKEVIDKSNFKYEQIKNLYYFPSGRWDIETKSGKLLKLPRDRLDQSFKIFINLLKDKNFKNAKVIDLRQYGQVIIND
tara:strand:+ start:1838 stop:2509 length:672 start_codon:yes stop_codon:yes gene_type:complete